LREGDSVPYIHTSCRFVLQLAWEGRVLGPWASQPLVSSRCFGGRGLRRAKNDLQRDISRCCAWKGWKKGRRGGKRKRLGMESKLACRQRRKKKKKKKKLTQQRRRRSRGRPRGRSRGRPQRRRLEDQRAAGRTLKNYPPSQGTRKGCLAEPDRAGLKGLNIERPVNPRIYTASCRRPLPAAGHRTRTRTLLVEPSR
jgi:hypothetical protein